MANNVNDVAMTWDDEIQNDGTDFRILPKGEYDFTVTNFKRTHFDGSQSMIACNRAEVTLRIHDPNGDVDIKKYFYLTTNKKNIQKICYFFISIGIVKPDEKKFRMDWKAAVGRKGRCKIDIQTWTGDDGKDHESNNITAFLKPSESSMNYATDRTSDYVSQSQSETAYTQEPLTSAAQPRKWTGGQF